MTEVFVSLQCAFFHALFLLNISLSVLIFIRSKHLNSKKKIEIQSPDRCVNSYTVHKSVLKDILDLEHKAQVSVLLGHCGTTNISLRSFQQTEGTYRCQCSTLAEYLSNCPPSYARALNNVHYIIPKITTQ